MDEKAKIINIINEEIGNLNKSCSESKVSLANSFNHLRNMTKDGEPPKNFGVFLKEMTNLSSESDKTLSVEAKIEALTHLRVRIEQAFMFCGV